MRTVFRERPENFSIDYRHSYADSAALLGLTRHVGGTLYTDSSAAANDGTLTNMDPASDWVWVSELGRWAVDLDGINDRVMMPSMNLGTANIAAMWVYPRSSAGSIVLGGAAGNYVLYKEAATIYYSTASYFTSTSFAFPLNTWTHYAVARSGTAVSFFINGVDAGSGTLAASQDLTLASLGGYGNGSFSFSGMVSDPLLYRRWLPADEISALADPANVMLALRPGQPGLITYRRKWWPVGSVNRRRRVICGA